MPFTLAHPAVVVPLYRRLGRYGVLSALVVGSMTPDFWYFLPLDDARAESHGLAGLFWFCLPMGLLAYVLFHLVLKRPLLGLLPAYVTDRIGGAMARPALPDARWGAVVVSIFIGAATHIAWDAFTHWEAPGVAAFPFLRTHLFSVGRYGVYVFTVLQYGSTLIGIALLAWWTARWLRTAAPTAARLPVSLTVRQRVLTVVLLAAVSAGAAVQYVLEITAAAPRIPPAHVVFRHALTPAVSAFAIALLSYSAVWYFLEWRSGTGRAGRYP